MFFYHPHPSTGSTVWIRPLFIPSALLLLSLPTTNAIRTTDPTVTAAEHSSGSPSTNSGLPAIVILCVVASGVFFIVLGSFMLYLYVRRSRERTKRNEYREKAWQFKDMQRRGGFRPTLKTEGISDVNEPIQISHPVLMTEATSSPRYPTRAFHW